jgi:hypothetical protein
LSGLRASLPVLCVSAFARAFTGRLAPNATYFVDFLILGGMGVNVGMAFAPSVRVLL